MDSNRILYKRDAADVARVSPLYGVPCTLAIYVGALRRVTRVHVAFSRPNDAVAVAVATLTFARPLLVLEMRGSRRATRNDDGRVTRDAFRLYRLRFKRDKSEIVTFCFSQANSISQLDDYMSTRAIISAALSSH